MTQEDLIKLVSQKVMERLRKVEDLYIPVGVSNKHIHLSQDHLEILFGPGYNLTEKKALGQPGQYAAEETVTVRGPKGEFKNVRILGSVRPRTQLEISKTDSFKLGVKSPIKESGDLQGSPGLELIGPKGKVQLEEGTIVALRHIHMTPEDARKMEVEDGDFVDVKVYGQRRATMSNVLIRVSDKYSLEMHVDTDEANAMGLRNKDQVILSKFI